MKQKILAKLLAVVLGGWLLVTPSFAIAGGATNSAPLEASASPTSAVANGSSTITINVFVYRYLCPDGYKINTPNCQDSSISTTKVGRSEQIGIFTSATDLVYGNTQTWSNGVHYVTTGDDGKASFTLASSTAGSKEVKVVIGDNGQIIGTEPVILNLTFTSSTPSVTTTPKKTTSSPAATPEPAPPETPKVATLEIAGQTIATTETIELAATEPLTLKGTTVANGIVKLYIFSTPQEATATADANGNWSYEIKDLEAGSHHVEAEVTDPATNKTSSRVTLAEFTVAEPEKIVAATTASTSNMTPWLIVGGVLLLGGAAGAVWWWRKRHNSRNTQSPSSPDKPDDDATIPPATPTENNPEQ